MPIIWECLLSKPLAYGGIHEHMGVHVYLVYGIVQVHIGPSALRVRMREGFNHTKMLMYTEDMRHPVRWAVRLLLW